MKIKEVLVPNKIIGDFRKNLRDPSDYFDEETVMIKTLKANGWKLLGRGTSGIVFSNPAKSYVIKFTINRDTPYDAFAKLTHSLNSKYLPRISDRKIIRIKNTSYYVYMIEKLVKADSKVCDIIRDYVELLVEINDVYTDPEEVQIDKQMLLKLDKSLKKYPGLTQTIQQLVKIARKRHYDLSIWGGYSPNILKRKDGTPVIADPFC